MKPYTCTAEDIDAICAVMTNSDSINMENTPLDMLLLDLLDCISLPKVAHVRVLYVTIAVSLKAAMF